MTDFVGVNHFNVWYVLCNLYHYDLTTNQISVLACINKLTSAFHLFIAGVEKVKEVKNKMQSGDELYVLMVAGLTDVLIKSVEEGKSKC